MNQTKGRLFYVIGASGAGKDTLLNYAKSRLNGESHILFAHRYITRPPFEGSENHISLTKEEFKQRKDAGLFAMHWSSHECLYGIGKEINSWMVSGFDVVVNGSREYLPVALETYPQLISILISASEDIISQRLMNRNRENHTDVLKRMARNRKLDLNLDHSLVIVNEGSIEEGGEALLNALTQK